MVMMSTCFLLCRPDSSGLSQCFNIAHRAGPHGHSLLLLQEQVRRRRAGVDLGCEGPGAAIHGVVLSAISRYLCLRASYFFLLLTTSVFVNEYGSNESH